MEDTNGRILSIELVPGDVAPRYKGDEWLGLTATKMVVTEKGMHSGFPLVDIQAVDSKGLKYFFPLTGSMLIALAAAVKGVNLRNHGVEDRP